METWLLLLILALLALQTPRAVQPTPWKWWQVNRIQNQLNLIMKHLGIEEEKTKELNERIQVLLKEGKYIEAIRTFRGATGAGLKEAKEEVDRLREK